MPDRRLQRILASVFLLSVFWAGLATAAHGGFGSSTAESMSISSGTLSAPGAPTLTNVECVAGISTKVKLDWPQTSSDFADGYEILRSLVSGGPYTSLGTVSGLGTLTFTDSAVSFLTPYYYVVQAKKFNWRSPNSAERSITTLTSLCL